MPRGKGLSWPDFHLSVPHKSEVCYRDGEADSTLSPKTKATHRAPPFPQAPRRDWPNPPPPLKTPPPPNPQANPKPISPAFKKTPPPAPFKGGPGKLGGGGTGGQTRIRLEPSDKE